MGWLRDDQVINNLTSQGIVEARDVVYLGSWTAERWGTRVGLNRAE